MHKDCTESIDKFLKKITVLLEIFLYLGKLLEKFFEFTFISCLLIKNGYMIAILNFSYVYLQIMNKKL